MVLEDGESAEIGAAIAQDLMEKLGISPHQLIEGAYIDLLTEGAEPVAALDRP